MQWRIAVWVHLAVCAAYPCVSYFGFWACEQLLSAHVVRGIDMGIAMRLILCFFIAVNLLMIAVRKTLGRSVIVTLAALSVFSYLVSDFPLRALASAGMFVGLGFMAIYLSSKFDLKLSAFVRN